MNPGDDEVGRVDARGRRGVAKGADRGDPIADDADVAAEPRRAGTVDDPPVGDDQVEARPLRGWARDERACAEQNGKSRSKS